MKQATEFPCHCTITSHQYHSEAECLGVAINQESGRPYALISESGTIRVLYLDGLYRVTLESKHAEGDRE